MNRIFKNNIPTKGILGFLVVFVFLIAPFSVSFQTPPVSTNIFTSPEYGLVLNTAHAEGGVAAFIVGKVFGGYADSMGTMIGYTFITIASLFLGIAGWILELSSSYLVFGMGEMFKGAIGSKIDTIWGFIRDICNLAFIFGFIFVGIRTIIDPEHADTKRFLSKIIIGALLINFSLFFTKSIIDFSNYTATIIYNEMSTGGDSLATTVVNQLGIHTIYNIGDTKRVAESIADGGALTFYIMAGIFMLITAFVFLAAALLLIMRFVTLVFIMLASPILFAATVFPQTEHFASDMWKKLIENAFFAPVYFLLVLISVSLIGSIKSAIPISSRATFAEALVNVQQNNIAIFLIFIIVIFFMVQSLLIASKLSIKGGDVAISTGNAIRGRIQSAVGRNTVGRGSEYLLHKYEHHDAAMAANPNSTMSKWSRGVRGALGVVGLDDRTIRGTLHAGEHAKFGGAYSFEDDEKYNKERKGRRGRINDTDRIEHAVEAGAAAVPGTVAGDQLIIDMERAIATASTEQIQGLLKEFKDKNKHVEYDAIIEKMTASQFDNILKLKPEDLDDDSKTKLRKKRAQTIVTKLGITADPRKIKNASTSDLEALDYPTLSAHAVHLTHKQIDEAKNLTATEKTKIKDKRKTELGDILMPGGAAATAATATSLLAHVGSDSEIAKLPETYLADPEVVKQLNTNILSIIMADGKMTKAERNVIRLSIATNVPAASPLNNYLSSPKGSAF